MTERVPVRDLTKLLLAIIIVAANVAIAVMIFNHEVPEKNQQSASIIWGGINMLTGAVFNHYFGSTASSQAKDATIATLAKKDP